MCNMVSERETKRTVVVYNTELLSTHDNPWRVPESERETKRTVVVYNTELLSTHDNPWRVPESVRRVSVIDSCISVFCSSTKRVGCFVSEVWEHYAGVTIKPSVAVQVS